MQHANWTLVYVAGALLGNAEGASGTREQFSLVPQIVHAQEEMY